jgi:hypothetical protein
MLPQHSNPTPAEINLDQLSKLFQTSLPAISGPPACGTHYICIHPDCTERLTNLEDCKQNLDHIQNHGKSFIKVSEFLSQIQSLPSSKSKIQDQLWTLSHFNQKLLSIISDFDSIRHQATKNFHKILDAQESTLTQTISKIFQSIKSGYQKIYTLKTSRDLTTISNLLNYSKIIKKNFEKSKSPDQIL